MCATTPANAASRAPGGAARRRVTWLGHATVLIESEDVRLLTDPVLRSRVAHLRRQRPAPRCPSAVDGVLVSHVHYDHLDRPSLRAVAAPVALVPRGASRWLRGTGFGAVRELAAGETATVGTLQVQAVPAWHPARRHPRAPLLETLGFVVDRIWFAGDTELNGEMEAMRGTVDVALVPIWGWGPSLGPGHMDPEEAARAMALVRPRVAVPIHWGTFLPLGHGRRHRRLLTEPPRAFEGHVARLAPEVRVAVIPPGGTLRL